MAFPPSDKSFEGVLKDTLIRLTLVERRLAVSGGGGGTGGEAVFAAGVVQAWSGGPGGVPNGWVLCDGRALSRTGYPALYAAIGTTYGVGDGSTTFNVPNGKGRVLVGQDSTQVEFDVVGEAGGAKTHTLTVAEIPSHQHQTHSDKTAAVFGTPGSGSYSIPASGNLMPLANGGTSLVGGDGAHNNLQPYLVANWIISTGAGSTSPTGAVVPVQLWQEFSLAGSGVIPVVGGSPAWTVVKGTLGATLSADKTTITLPAAGTYRIVPHIGVSATNQTAANANANIGGTNYPPSFGYGAGGPAGAWSYDTEFVVVVTGPTTLRHYVSSSGVYDWSWLRIEKMEPFFPNSALTVNQGSTAQRDAIYGVPTTDPERASLANRIISWFNTDRGWHETYYAVTGTAGLVAPGRGAAGWRPPGGSVGVIPTSVAVSGGSATVSGHQVTFTAVSSVSLNGIFDPLIADEYVVECKITTGPGAGGWVRMRKAGVDTATPTYGNQQAYNSAATTLAALYSATTGWVFAPVPGTQEKFTLKLSAPATAGPEYVFAHLESTVQTAGGLVNGSNKGTISGLSYDGLTVQSASGTISGWLRVYALT